MFRTFRFLQSQLCVKKQVMGCKYHVTEHFLHSKCIRFMGTSIPDYSENERMDYDVVIVGGGCAGLSTAIRLKREAVLKNLDISVCILEKGETIGSHILSGCLLDPSSLSKLIPDWKDRDSPITQKVTKESMHFLVSKTKSLSIPSCFIPRPAKHTSSYIVSLSNVCRWLSSIAEEEGIDIFTDISASGLIKEKDRVVGVVSADKGVDRSGAPKEDYQKGYAFYSKCIVLAEGALGSLTEQVIADYHLQSNYPRSYGLGIKEIWEIPEEECRPGTVIHTVGFPLQRSLMDSIYGGGFIYYEQPNLIHIGLITGLDYQNTNISPYEEFQNYKKSNFVSSLLKNAQRVEYGARVIYEGGKLGQCKSVFPGGCIIGDSLGVVNMATLQGTNNAIESGILLADALIENWNRVEESIPFQETLDKSDLTKQLQRSRSLRGVYEHSLLFGMAYAFISGSLLFNHNLLTHALSKGEDYEKTLTKQESTKFKSRGYEKPDDKLTFSRESSLAFSSISYPQNEQAHITVKEGMESVPVETSFKVYGAPEERFCPAHVYEYIQDENGVKLQVNSENCLHCKTCVIKMPKQYIDWKVPSSGGPNYSNM